MVKINEYVEARGTNEILPYLTDQAAAGHLRARKEVGYVPTLLVLPVKKVAESMQEELQAYGLFVQKAGVARNTSGHAVVTLVGSCWRLNRALKGLYYLGTWRARRHPSRPNFGLDVNARFSEGLVATGNAFGSCSKLAAVDLYPNTPSTTRIALASTRS